jgi:hypothetical protein
VIARALHAITPLIENQMVVRKALHEPVSVRNRTSLRTAHREIRKIAGIRALSATGLVRK